MSNNSNVEKENLKSITSQPDFSKSKTIPTKSPYSSYYGSSPVEISGNQMQGGINPQINQGYAQQAYYSQDNQQYGQPFNQQFGGQYGQPNAPQYNQPAYPQYNQPIPPQYNQPTPIVAQKDQPTPTPTITPTPTPTQPFSFFPTLEGVQKTQVLNTPQAPHTPNQPFTDYSNPNLNIYNSSLQSIQAQALNPLKEIYSLKARHRSLAYRNPDTLPVEFRTQYKTTQFVKNATIISIFFYSAFKSSYLMNSGMDKKLIFMRCLNFFFIYVIATTGFNYIETKQLDKAFEYSYGAMSIPMIDAELKKLREVNPILKY